MIKQRFARKAVKKAVELIKKPLMQKKLRQRLQLQMLVNYFSA